jgi:poly-beta-hydroxyalkanoate depolymerase
VGEGVVAVRSGENGVMLYQAYQAHSDIMVPVRMLAASTCKAIGQPLGITNGTSLRNLTAAYAAHDLCTSLRPYLKRHHMQAGVGHYGVFSGKTWENQIFPILKNVILSSD